MGFFKKMIDALNDNTPVVAWKINDNERSFFFMGSWTRRIMPKTTKVTLFDKPKDVNYEDKLEMIDYETNFDDSKSD